MKAKKLFRDCIKEARYNHNVRGLCCPLPCTPCSVHLGSKPAVISLSGVECMKDDPSAVDVLFARVNLTDSSDRCVYMQCMAHRNLYNIVFTFTTSSSLYTNLTSILPFVYIPTFDITYVLALAIPVSC